MKKTLYQLVLVLLLVRTSFSTPVTDDTAKEVCYGNLGCFQINKEFLSQNKFIKLPESPEKINTQFLLYTKYNEVKKLVYKDLKSFQTSGYDNSYFTKIIVHGFREKDIMVNEWMIAMKNAFLDFLGNENVILVDWSNGNQMPYSQAASNTRVVGAEIARMIMWLEEISKLSFSRVLGKYINRADFHCIGHSLGAHICGYAGERLKGEKGQLGRITGLDPAELYFEHMGRTVRLDYTDAAFVDIIHTDSEPFLVGVSMLQGGLGLKAPAGHVDFYPNGGKNQPGCERKLSIVIDATTELESFITCDHARAYLLMIATIRNPNLYYKSYECQDYDTFKQGKCLSCTDNKCASMGLRANEWKPNGRTNVLMYLDTSDQDPFHLTHYNVQIKISPSSKKRYGNFYIKLIESSTLETEEVKFKSNINIEPGATYSGLVATRQNIDTVTAVQVWWENRSFVSSFMTITIKLEEVRVYKDTGATQAEWVFPAHNKEIKSKTIITLNSQ